MEHHFVPRFYLRGFRDPSIPEGQEPWLWVADLKERVVGRRAPKNIGKAANYYASPEFDQTAEETVEQGLSKIESTVAPVVKKLLRGELDLTGQERVDLLFFMAFFVARVPFFRNTIEQFAADVAKMILQVSASHPEHFEQTFREALKGQDELTPEEIEEKRKWVLDDTKYTVKASPKLSLAIGFQAALNTIFPIFDQMRWLILQAGESERFITCDSPVSWFDPTPRPAFYSGHGLGMRNVEVTFPIGPEVALLGTWEGGTGYKKVPDRVVTEFNRRRVAFADRHVFADSSDRAQWALGVRQEMEEPR